MSKIRTVSYLNFNINIGLKHYGMIKYSDGSPTQQCVLLPLSHAPNVGVNYASILVEEFKRELHYSSMTVNATDAKFVVEVEGESYMPYHFRKGCIHIAELLVEESKLWRALNPSGYPDD